MIDRSKIAGIRVSQRCFEQILAQIVYLEETGDNIADWIDINLPLERQELILTARRYKQTLEELIRSLVVVENNPRNKIPLMLVYARAKVEGLTNNDLLEIKLIPPYRGTKPRTQRNLLTASLLSPWGKALLLRAPGEEVQVVTPAGQRIYRILDIEY